MDKWKFSDNKKESDYLFSLVKKGIKTATSSLYNPSEEDLPKVGETCMITNYDETEYIIIKYKSVNILPFLEITEDFAKKEGEGDLSLEFWQETHREFFSRMLKISTAEFSHKTLVLCEEFEVLSSEI